MVHRSAQHLGQACAVWRKYLRHAPLLASCSRLQSIGQWFSSVKSAHSLASPRIAGLGTELEMARDELHAAKAELEAERARVREILASTFWRPTALLRWISTAAREAWATAAYQLRSFMRVSRHQAALDYQEWIRQFDSPDRRIGPPLAFAFPFQRHVPAVASGIRAHFVPRNGVHRSLTNTLYAC